MAIKVTGDLYEKLDGKLIEIKRQMRQRGGYPYNPNDLDEFLQRAIEGKFHASDIKWQERGGMIFLDLVSNGMTGKEWLKHFESENMNLEDDVKNILLSENFESKKKGTVYHVAILKEQLFHGCGTISKVRLMANSYEMSEPPVEVACLLCDMFANQDTEAMGLSWVMVMSEPKGSMNKLLTIRHQHSLDTYPGDPQCTWPRAYSFAFLALPE